MQGINNLNDLPQTMKDKISEEYGSIGGLYKKVFDLSNEDYDLETKKPKDYNKRQEEIREELFDIEEKLDEIGVSGDMIVSDISTDFGDIIVSRNIKELDNHLRTLGTDYETMKKWMKDNYNL